MDDPTHNPEIERALVGAMLHASGGARDTIAAMLAEIDPGDIYLESMRWAARSWVATDGGDVGLMLAWLRDAGEVETVGGAAELRAIAGVAAPVGRWREYHAIVAGFAKRRALRAALVKSLGMLDAGTDTDEVAEAAVLAVNRAASSKSDDLTWAIPEANKALLAHGAAMRAMRADGSGFSWGCAEMDEHAPVVFGQMVIVAARPSVGKTSVVLGGMTVSAKGTADAPGLPGLVITGEMTREALAGRIAYQETGVPELDLLSGDIPARFRDPLREHMIASKGWPLYLSSVGRSWPRIVREIRAQIAARGVRVVMIDYLQLLNLGRDLREGSGWGAIATEFGAMCRELNIAGILLSQLNRSSANEERPPRMEDIRYAGEAEEAAARIVMLHRPNMHATGSPGGGGRVPMSAPLDLTHVIKAKERYQGPGGVPEPLLMASRFGRLVPMSNR